MNPVRKCLVISLSLLSQDVTAVVCFRYVSANVESLQRKQNTVDVFVYLSTLTKFKLK